MLITIKKFKCKSLKNITIKCFYLFKFSHLFTKKSPNILFSINLLFGQQTIKNVIQLNYCAIPLVEWSHFTPILKTPQTKSLH